MMTKIQSRDGTPIACWSSGSGLPLLLVHGTTADHTRWSSVLPALEEKCTVYVLDRRGRGESGDTAPYAIEREFEDIATVINSIGGSVDVLGHSYGALCVLGAALLTENIRRMILYEPYLHYGVDIYPTGVANLIEAMVEAGDREEAVALMFRELLRMTDEEVEELRVLPSWKVRVATAHTIARETRAEEQFRLNPDEFSRLTIPTLLLQGGESLEFLKESTALAHRILPNSRIALMPGQQHIAMNTAPELFAATVTDFVLGDT